MSRRIWSASELQLLSPTEQDAVFASALVRDLAEVPPEFLARVRTRLEQHVSGSDSPAE